MVESTSASSASTSSQLTEHKTTTTRRYWKRTDTPQSGWWPWGWLPLLGLLLLMLYGLFKTAPHMQADVQEQVTRVLTAAGYDNAYVTANGQGVTVEAVGSESLKPTLEALARSATCNTWLAKNVVCPNRVTVNLTAPEPAKVELPKATSVESDPEPVVRLHEITLSKTETAVRLQGEVPSADFKNELVARARSMFPNIVDELRVSNEMASPDISWATGHMLTMLQAVNTGGASWKNGSLSAWGVVAKNQEGTVRTLFGSVGKPERLGNLSLDFIRTADACNEQFAAVLADATIEFRTSSAEISAASQPLLERLAQLAAQCPIALVIEGHTDSRGAPQMNQQLSMNRAESVVYALGSLGVDITRLTARGFGPDRPIADNQTREGRARNRRIEIKAAAGL